MLSRKMRIEGEQEVLVKDNLQGFVTMTSLAANKRATNNKMWT